jgi:hypothetical protein
MHSRVGREVLRSIFFPASKVRPEYLIETLCKA